MIILLICPQFTALRSMLLVVRKMFSGSQLTGVTLLTGFAGAFLAFSGLESIRSSPPSCACRAARR